MIHENICENKWAFWQMWVLIFLEGREFLSGVAADKCPRIDCAAKLTGS